MKAGAEEEGYPVRRVTKRTSVRQQRLYMQNDRKGCLLGFHLGDAPSAERKLFSKLGAEIVFRAFMK
jgi:hypothetical protein